MNNYIFYIIFTFCIILFTLNTDYNFYELLKKYKIALLLLIILIIFYYNNTIGAILLIFFGIIMYKKIYKFVGGNTLVPNSSNTLVPETLISEQITQTNIPKQLHTNVSKENINNSQLNYIMATLQPKEIDNDTTNYPLGSLDVETDISYTNIPIKHSFNRELLETAKPTNVPTNIPDNVPTNIPDNVPTNVPDNVSTNIPDNVPTNFSMSEVETKIPNNVVLDMETMKPKNNKKYFIDLDFKNPVSEKYIDNVKDFISKVRTKKRKESLKKSQMIFKKPWKNEIDIGTIFDKYIN
jgi:hypothetical protein